MFNLRDYQIEISKKAATILKEHGLVCLAMEVRTGKTITSLNVAKLCDAHRVLFVTKKKAIASIKGDFDAINANFNLYVCNYEQLPKVDPNDFDFVIIDECHALSAFPVPSIRAKLLKKICVAKPVIFLSGTFTPESYSQIYHILWVSCNSPFRDYKNFYAWAKDYVNVKKRYFYNRECNDYKAAIKEKVEAATRHLFIAFTQAQAGFTQMVDEYVLPVKMKESTYALAKKIATKRVHIGKDGEEIIADTEVKVMQKLHQIYSGTVILDNRKEAICFDDTKARFITEHFKGQKIAVFYKFKAELELLKWAFKSQVTESPEEFKSRNDLVFVSQIQSGREGINLSTADALVMFNIDFAHVSYIQSKARLQTKERTKACPLYWVFAEGGIEQKIYEKVKAKQDYVLSYFRQDYQIESIKKTA